MGYEQFGCVEALDFICWLWTKRRVDVPCRHSFTSHLALLFSLRSCSFDNTTLRFRLSDTNTHKYTGTLRGGCRPRTTPRLEAVSEGGREGGDINESSGRGRQETRVSSMSSAAFQDQHCSSAPPCTHTLGAAQSPPISLYSRSR